MAEYSLVPVDYQPDFPGVSLVPVDHDPFGAGGATQPPPLQLAQPVLQSAQPQPASPRPGSSTQQPPTGVGQPNVVASTVGAQTTAPMQLNPYPAGYPTYDSSYGPSIINAVRGMFNPSFDEDKRIVSGIYDAAKDALLAPGRLMQPNPYPPGSEEAFWYEDQRQKAMIPAAANIATLLAGFGLPMAESGAVGALGGRGVAGSAARQAISEAEATLPEGMTRKDFGRLAGFEQSLADSGGASTEPTAEVISRLQSAGITSRSVAAFQKFYENAASQNPSNLSAVHRAALLANILRSFQ